jgi:hypothetical protein
VAALYIEAQALRKGGSVDEYRLRSLEARARNHPAEWLLHAEVAELEAMR